MGDNNNLRNFQKLPEAFKNNFINEKNSIKDFYKSEILDENVYEWKITDWNNNQESDIFVIGDSKWKLKLYPNGFQINNNIGMEYPQINKKNNSNFAIGLCNCNCHLLISKKDYVCVKYFIYIRKDEIKREDEPFIVKHSNDIYTYFGRGERNPKNEQIFENFCNLETLNELIVNNTRSFVIGVYIRIYNEMNIDFSKEKYVNKLINSITSFNDDGEVIPDILNTQDEFFFEYLMPKYKNEKSLNIGNRRIRKYYTPSFRSRDHIWRIKITIHRANDSDYDEESDDDVYINIYLECVDNNKFLNNIYTKFVISIRNFDSYKNPKIKATCREINEFVVFDATRRRYGFREFTYIENLKNIRHDKDLNKNNFEENNYYFVKDDKFVVSLYCRIFKYNNEQEYTILNDNKILSSIENNYFESEADIENSDTLDFNDECKFITGYRIIKVYDNNNIPQIIQVIDCSNKITESNKEKDIKAQINQYFFNNGLYYMVYSPYINEILTNCISDKEIFGLKLLINYSINENIILKINKQNKDKDYPLLFAAKENDIEVVNLIIDYANNRKIKLLINEHNNDGWYPLLWAIFNNNYKMAESIINYANKNDILLDINKKNNYLSYPLLFATYKSNVNLVNLVIKYANDKNIKLKINDKNKDCRYPLLRAIKEDNTHIVKSLISYATEKKMKLEINEKSNDGWYPLLWAIFQNNLDIVESLINYANQNKIVLDINGENQYGNYPLLIAIEKKNDKLVKKLIDYAKNNNTKLEIEKRNNIEWYPLARAVNTNNYKIVELLIEYAFNIKINLVIFEKDIDDISKIDSDILILLNKNYMLNIIRIKMEQDSSFLENIHNKIKNETLNDLNKYISENNESYTKQTLDNAEKNYIYLDINKKDKDDLCPLSKAIKNNNKKIVKLLINYGVKNKIKLNFDENDMKNGFSINNNIINLLYKYINENKIDIKFKENKSEIKEKFKKKRDISEYYLNSISEGSVKQLKEVMDKAKLGDVILEEINKSNCEGDYPLLMAVKDENIDIINLLIDYANENNFTLELNKKDNNGNYPFLEAVTKKNMEIMELLIKYSEEKNIDLTINEKNNKETTPIYKAIYDKNVNIIRKLINYSNKKNIILNINEPCKSDYPVLCNIENNYEKISNDENNKITIYILKLLINYSDKFGIILELNKKDNKGNYPLLSAVKYNNIDVVKLLIAYATYHNIMLNINESDENNYYPILYATKNTENKKYKEEDIVEIIDILIDYANKINIILDIRKNFKNKNYPLLNVIKSNNSVILNKLIEYAEKNKIILELKEKHIENISKISNNILKILKKSYKANKINIKFRKENSELHQKMFEINEYVEIDYLNIYKSVVQVNVSNKFIKKMKEKINNKNNNNKDELK